MIDRTHSGLLASRAQVEERELSESRDDLALTPVWDAGELIARPYQVRNGYFSHYDEDEQRVLTDANLVFSVTPTRVFAFAIGLSQTRYQF